MKAKEWLKQKGIHPTEPIYWDTGEKNIYLDELMDEFVGSITDKANLRLLNNLEELLACPFCGDQATEIKDMGEINAAQRGIKPVNPFGCRNCGIFMSTKEDWNMRDGQLTDRA